MLEKDIKKRINLKEALEDYWLIGARILIDEKEKLNNDSLFLSYLILDYFSNFTSYISN